MMYMRSILISLFLSLFFINAFAAPEDIHFFKKTYQSTSGVVTFDHGSHAFGRVKDCAFCHSALKTFGGKMNELFAHNFCKACHESNNGPSECKGCHGRKLVSIE